MRRIIFYGGARCDDWRWVRSTLDVLVIKHSSFVVVSCGSGDVDLMIDVESRNLQELMREHGANITITVETFRAKWEPPFTDVDTAIARRNAAMIAAGADGVVLFPGGLGIDDMLARAEAAGVPVWRRGWE